MAYEHPPPYSLRRGPTLEPPPYSLPHLSMAQPSASSSNISRFQQLDTQGEDHRGSPVPTTTAYRTTSYELLKGQAPLATTHTFIPAWAPLVFHAAAASHFEGLWVQTVTHRKHRFFEYQHELLLIEVVRDGVMLHIAVQRAGVEDEPGSTKKQGPADDRLIILAADEVSDYTRIPVVRTLQWEESHRPPLHEVIALLCLISAEYPIYLPTAYNCYHYAAVACLSIERYRPKARPLSSSGDVANKASRILGRKLVHPNIISWDAALISITFYECQSGRRFLSQAVPQGQGAPEF